MRQSFLASPSVDSDHSSPHTKKVDSDTKKVLAYGVASIIGFLMAGNMFFVSRLVNKIDNIETMLYSFREEFIAYKSEHRTSLQPPIPPPDFFITPIPYLPSQSKHDYDHNQDK